MLKNTCNFYKLCNMIRFPALRYCPMTDVMRARKTTQECTMLTLEIRIAIAVSAVVGFLLFACAIFCWKRSKKSVKNISYSFAIFLVFDFFSITKDIFVSSQFSKSMNEKW